MTQTFILRHLSHWWYPIAQGFCYFYFKEMPVGREGKKLAQGSIASRWSLMLILWYSGKSQGFLILALLLRCGILEKPVDFSQSLSFSSLRNDNIYLRGLLRRLNIRCLGYNSWQFRIYTLPFSFLVIWYQIYLLSSRQAGFCFSVLLLPHKAGKECKHFVIYWSV